MTAKLLEKTETICLSVLERLQLAWWIEVVTVNPCRIHYFGPFLSANKAKLYQSGYIQQIKQGATKIIAVNIKKCQPVKQTIDEDELLESLDSSISPKLARFAQIHDRS